MDGRCRRHPEHRQSKGVCPFCLREKLNTLSASSSATTTIASSTTSSSAKFTASGRSSAAAGSPPRDQSTANAAVLPSLKPELLKKSRSLAFAAGTQRGGYHQEAQGKKEKGKLTQKKRRSEGGGFWSKLVMMSAGSQKRKQVDEDMPLQYSKTLKEKPGAKWVIF